MFRLLKIPVVDVFVLSRWKIFGLVSGAAISPFVLTVLASIVRFNVTRNVHHHQNAQNNDHHHDFDKNNIPCCSLSDPVVFRVRTGSDNTRPRSGARGIV
jgi:hypothetical protein